MECQSAVRWVHRGRTHRTHYMHSPQEYQWIDLGLHRRNCDFLPPLRTIGKPRSYFERVHPFLHKRILCFALAPMLGHLRGYTCHTHYMHSPQECQWIDLCLFRRNFDLMSPLRTSGNHHTHCERVHPFLHKCIAVLMLGTALVVSYSYTHLGSRSSLPGRDRRCYRNPFVRPSIYNA